MNDLFRAENTEFQLHCGTAVTGVGAGHCKNPKCQRVSASLLGGYCTSCAAARGLNPLKQCGCQPIVLTQSAMAAAAAS